MLRLFQFIVKYQAFLVFLLLEILCTWMIISNNRYQNAAFFNSSNQVAGTLLNINQNVSSYFALRKVNQTLIEENALLQTELTKLQKKLTEIGLNHATSPQRISNYNFITAKVVNNSTRRAANYLTINKGSDDLVNSGMAVIIGEGVVGKVKTASRNFATVISILHPDVLTSTVMQSSNTICTVNWDGRDPTTAEVLYVPRHVPVSVGDTVVTSGYNAVFPPGIPVGVVSQLDLREEGTFYDIEIKFTTEFDKLSYVFVVGNQLKTEKDSLENLIPNP